MINYANEVSKYSLFHLTESISNLRRIFSFEKKLQPEVEISIVTPTKFFQGCLIKDGIIELTSRAKPVFLKTTLLTQLG